MSVDASMEEVSREDIAAIEQVLRHIDRSNAQRATLAPLANWILALRIYKDVELRFTCMKDRSNIAQAHRALLSTIMATGEWMLAASESFDESDLKSIQTSREALLANVKYLRMKYAQWYGARDPRRIQEINAAIDAAKVDERPNPA
jgi:hypothetical protein